MVKNQVTVGKALVVIAIVGFGSTGCRKSSGSSAVKVRGPGDPEFKNQIAYCTSLPGGESGEYVFHTIRSIKRLIMKAERK